MTSHPPKNFDSWDRYYDAFRRDNPGVSFTKVQMERTAERLKAGASHPTLGPRIDGHEDWWSAGASTFAQYTQLFPIHPGSRVVDYGCGSLRVGAHFIRFLNRGCYFGLELARGLYELGEEVIGAELLREKEPKLGLIDTSALGEAIAFEADFVYSTSVAFHVHPDELRLYHANLVRLTRKPGATLFFDTKISATPLRYRERSWAWPLQMYREALAPLEFVRQIGVKERMEGGVKFENQILEFRRGA